MSKVDLKQQAKPQPQPQSVSGFDRPSQAIDEFLDTLLEPVREYHPSQDLKPLPQPVVAPPVVEMAEKAEQVVSAAEAVEVTVEPVTPLPAPLPDYSSGPFQCLMFRVADSDFAVPLMSLNGIVRWGKTPGKLPGQPVWHKGVLTYRDKKMGVVDLASLLQIPNGQDEEKRNFIIVFDGGHFGLICSKLFRPVALEREQVKWREQRQERPWMLGTLREQLCPLLDMEALASMLR